MEFKRFLNLSKVKKALEQALKETGIGPSDAERSAQLMQRADIDQVYKDLKRHPKIVVLNKKTGDTKTLIIGTEPHKKQFSSAKSTEDFLRSLAGDNEALYDYLSCYLHQGGFLHLSEFLMTSYFASKAVLPTEGRVATFTLENDGALTFEEKFDIQQIKSPDLDYQAPAGKPIASFKLKSTIRIQGNNIEHHYENIEVIAHDRATAKFFEDPDPKNTFQRFLRWLKESLEALLSRKKTKVRLP